MNRDSPDHLILDKPKTAFVFVFWTCNDGIKSKHILPLISPWMDWDAAKPLQRGHV